MAQLVTMPTKKVLDSPFSSIACLRILKSNFDVFAGPHARAFTREQVYTFLRSLLSSLESTDKQHVDLLRDTITKGIDAVYSQCAADLDADVEEIEQEEP